MGSVRNGRINDELMRELSFLLRTVKDPRVSGIVSIVRVDCTADLSSAKVYVSALGGDGELSECIKGLRSASGYLRREAARNMRLRHMPELTFIADSSIVTGNRIFELIENVSRKDTEKRTLDIAGAAEFLKTRDDILILTHKSPDGDTMGSAAAFAAVLRAMGKNACVFENPEFSKKQKKYVRPYLYKGDFEPKCVISVDCAELALLTKDADDFSENIDLAIDHHETHKSFARRELVISGAAACGEIIIDIADALGVKITKKIAAPLYIAISTDTGRFLHTNTTPETHIKASRLLPLCDHTALDREFLIEKSRAAIAIEGAAMSSMKYYFGGKVAVLSLTDEMIKAAGASAEDLDGVSSLTRVCTGVLLGIYIHSRDGKAKISLRSDESISAADICAHFGGGGHRCAAGATLDMSLEDAETAVINHIKETELF